MKIPHVYTLKREAARKKVKFGDTDKLGGLPAAPVFVFDMEDIISTNAAYARDALMKQDHPLTGPYDHYLFEAVYEKNNYGDIFAVYAIQEDSLKVFYLFSHFNDKWHIICRLLASYVPNPGDELPYTLQYDYNPVDPEVHALLGLELNKPGESLKETLQSIFFTIIIRGLAILAVKHTEEKQTVSRLRRQMLNAPGVAGWEYHILKIDPLPSSESASPADVHSEAPGGTHASPRWHMRRGHWRCLKSGRRVFVRATEVGSKDRGGIVKDYEIERDEKHVR